MDEHLTAQHTSKLKWPCRQLCLPRVSKRKVDLLIVPNVPPDVLTHKAAVTAALALALYSIKHHCSLHEIFLSQSNGTQADLIIPSSSGRSACWGHRSERSVAQGRILCSLSVSYMLKMMLWPTIRTSLTHL